MYLKMSISITQEEMFKYSTCTCFINYKLLNIFYVIQHTFVQKNHVKIIVLNIFQSTFYKTFYHKLILRF